jgi:hypothetical protein
VALHGPDCAKAVYGQVTMAFPGNNIIQEAPEPIAGALALVAKNPPGGVAVAVSIRVLDADGISLDCCPDGYVFDAAGRTCVLKPVVVNPPPKPPPPKPPPPPPSSDGGGDELETNFGTLFIELRTIIDLIQKLTAGQPQTVDYTKCCHAIIVALMALVKVVGKIEVAITSQGAQQPPAVDLSSVVTELNCVCEKLTAISTSSATVATDLGPGLKSIAEAITKLNPTDVSQIVEQLKALVKTIDPPPAVYDQLAKDGYIDAQYVQLFESGEFGSGLVTILATKLWHGVVWALKLIGIDVSVWPPNITNLEAGLKTAATKVGSALLQFSKSGVYDAVKGLVGVMQTRLIPTAVPQLGDIHVDPDRMLTDVVGLSLDGILIAAIIGAFLPEVGKKLGELVGVAGGLLGFDELRDVQIGPLIRHGISKIAEMNAKRVFRQELPAASQLAALAARGLIHTDRYGQLAPLTGIPTELQGAELEAAHTGLQPFILLRLANTGLFTDRDLADEMTFRGVRPESQHRILLAAPFIATQKERDALRGTIEKAYAGGLFADIDFTGRIDALEHETDRTRLILDRARLERTLAVLKEVENAYETEFLAGITDAPTYQSKLQGIGLQLDYVAGIMAKAEAHANARMVRQAEASERALQKATTAAERRAAATQYAAGTIDEARLAGTLVATGLTPVQAAAWVIQAQGQRAGKLRRQFGLLLSPPEATLLRQKVADLTHQRELQMLTDAQFVQKLTALKIPPTWVNVLRAGANAALKPKTAAILTPVTTV